MPTNTAFGTVCTPVAVTTFPNGSRLTVQVSVPLQRPSPHTAPQSLSLMKHDPVYSGARRGKDGTPTAREVWVSAACSFLEDLSTITVGQGFVTIIFEFAKSSPVARQQKLRPKVLNKTPYSQLQGHTSCSVLEWPYRHIRFQLAAYHQHLPDIMGT